jgi:O-acetyl-ADP-ribose deacetylase (regulator of RNase III)
MNILLVHHQDDALAAQWERWFSDLDDVRIVAGDICDVEADAVVSPANSFGFMDGGLDYALSERFGWELQTKLQQTIAARPLKELLVGEALLMPTGDAKVPWLISAPTMRVPMKLRQTINAYLAMKAILLTATSASVTPPIQTVAIPGLGTGVGALSADTAALQMWRAYQEVVLQDFTYPANFGDAQRDHMLLNPREILIWD